MSRSKIYTGGCHCGRVRFEAACDLSKVYACNCSFCGKRGVLWNMVAPSQFKLLQGADALTDYQFGRKVIHHRFCASCGIGSFSHGPPPGGRDVVAIDVRCLDDVDIGALTPTLFDGKSL
jgi:hypothetical protein